MAKVDIAEIMKPLDGFPFLHEEVLTADLPGGVKVEISRSLAGDALYLWVGEPEGLKRERFVVPLRPIFAAIIDTYLERSDG